MQRSTIKTSMNSGSTTIWRWATKLKRKSKTKPKQTNNESNNKPLFEAQQITKEDNILREKFAEAIAKQSQLMDEVGKLLITIELATPAIFATILKLIKGDSGVLKIDTLTFWNFFLWFVALIITFVAIFPKKYKVDKNNLTEIEAFFRDSAKFKAKALIVSAVIYSVGIFMTLYTIFKG